MATIKYKGMELEEYLSNKPVVFDPPKRSICVDEVGRNECDVVAFIPGIRTPVICTDSTAWLHFAILPEKPAPRRATWKELAHWLLDGKGLVLDENRGKIDTGAIFNKEDLDEEVSDYLKVMHRDDDYWHEPTAEYMGITEEDE